MAYRGQLYIGMYRVGIGRSWRAFVRGDSQNVQVLDVWVFRKKQNICGVVRPFGRGYRKQHVWFRHALPPNPDWFAIALGDADQHRLLDLTGHFHPRPLRSCQSRCRRRV